MATTTGEACDSLLIGSFYFIGINAWPTVLDDLTNSTTQRHGEVLMFGFQDIPGGLDLYLTDRAWTDEGFVPNFVGKEGILKFTTPPQGVPSGVAFGIGNNTQIYKYAEEWMDEDVDGTQAEVGGNETHYFDLGLDGDQVFLYCVGGDGKDRPIAGISYNGDFAYQDTYGTNKSSAPGSFQEHDTESGANRTTLLVMPTVATEDETSKIFLDWQYVGPMSSLNFFELQDAIRDTENNWLGRNPDGTTSGSPSNTCGTMVVPNVLAFLLFSFLALK